MADQVQTLSGEAVRRVLTTLAASRTDALLDGGSALVPATGDGYRPAFAVATGSTAAAPAPATAVLRPGGRT
ncbi:hypothetical protein SGFS_031580 [Streptomyces graminofaciens]|uniref:Uncharacterized protein n=1 Tax=Streptomyces graminofaciens TaxID=68212 RepID=A0ABM7F7I1_9ACTN|nr:hypothetical protein [Streptomyces graminofaciens]BBC31864.1 hypothetical protein SGFS_031580 [Streptomyces graminofaciens]